MRSINPSTGEIISEYADHTPDQVEMILAGSFMAKRCWRNFSLEERGNCLREAAAAINRQKLELAGLVTLEMGKPRAEALSEVERCVAACRYYADSAEAMLAPEHPEGSPGDALVAYEPLGVVLAIMPWNFPLWQAVRCAAPALMAGNPVLLKHAPNVTGCALALEKLLSHCGMPEDVFRVLLLPDERVPDVIADRRVRAVSLTGSCRAGSAVAEAAGRALKKVVLELGGSDPFIVLEDADLERALAVAVEARFYNGGQTCASAKRFLVARSVVREFEQGMAGAVQRLTMGDPFLPEVKVGPMARADLRENLERQVRESVAMGARVLVDGGSVPGPGYFFKPMALGNVRPGMPLFDEEVFGPVACITSVADSGEALRTANQTRYGLGASIWTRNAALARKMAGLIEAGTVAVNAPVKSDLSLPFGGVKDSGFGREQGRQGMLEFVNVKTYRGL